MTKFRSNAWRAAAAVIVAVFLTLSTSVTAQAATFCYEGSAKTISKSSKAETGNVTISSAFTYKPLFSCSGTQVGVHVTSARASYTGGFAGKGDGNSVHGITAFGMNMFNENVTGFSGSPAWNGSIVNLTGVRSVSRTYDKYVYTGKFAPDQSTYSFADISVYALFTRPNGPQVIGTQYNTWLKYRTSTFHYIEIGYSVPGKP